MHEADAARQYLRMACGDMVEFLAWREDQHINGPQHYDDFGALARRNQAEGANDPPQTIEVCVQRFVYDAVEDWAGDLRDGRVIVAVSAVRGIVGLIARADDEDAVGPHVQRWADRGDLAHGSIAEIFAMDLHGLKYQWDRGRGHDVLKTDFRGCADAPRAPPRRHRVHALIKRHRLARAVAGTGDTQRMQVPLVDRRLDATEFELFAEQLVQRRAIEQGVRIVFAQASEHHGCKPARTGGHHTGDVGTEDLLRVKVFPHVHQPVHAEVKVCGVYREGRAVNGTR